jgi:hypothetical protein
MINKNDKNKQQVSPSPSPSPLNEIRLTTILIKFMTKKHLPTLSPQMYYNMQNIQQYFNYFFTNNYYYQIIPSNYNNTSHITVWDEFFINQNIMKPNEINLLLSVENITKWKFYPHYKKFKNYGNPLMNIYLYNHIYKIEYTKKYLAIPLIYYRVNYYESYKHKIKPSIITPFENKKFCLMINRSNLNSDIRDFYNLLTTIGPVDNISLFDNVISQKSCYNSVELLNVFNKYKFILCFENSYQNGYVTEKIFNCFLSGAIPIYKGAPNILEYFSETSFINVNHTNESDETEFLEKIKYIATNETEYNKFTNSNIITPTYNDENYKTLFSRFIHNKLYNILKASH